MMVYIIKYTETKREREREREKYDIQKALMGFKRGVLLNTYIYYICMKYILYIYIYI